MSESLERAVIEAFVYVAASDGNFAAPELERFVAWAKEQPLFADAEPAQLAARFGDVAARFVADFAEAERSALALIAEQEGSSEAADLLLNAAGVAVVADGALKEVEETAVDRVARALGREPSNR